MRSHRATSAAYGTLTPKLTSTRSKFSPPAMESSFGCHQVVDFCDVQVSFSSLSTSRSAKASPAGARNSARVERRQQVIHHVSEGKRFLAARSRAFQHRGDLVKAALQRLGSCGPCRARRHSGRDKRCKEGGAFGHAHRKSPAPVRLIGIFAAQIERRPAQRRNGLLTRSRAIVLPDPWPQVKATSSPSGSSLSFIDAIS
jgi:hypothetical protein